MPNISTHAGITAAYDNGRRFRRRYLIHAADRYGEHYAIHASDNQMPNGVFMVSEWETVLGMKAHRIAPETLPPQVRRKVRRFILDKL